MADAMKTIRLAIVRQKYRPDGGAERFISRALEALDDQNIELNIITRQWEGKPNPNCQMQVVIQQQYAPQEVVHQSHRLKKVKFLV
jgi:UDP-glucose:(heptosyl)LPS alpha-1,3-glucosyltransferase